MRKLALFLLILGVLCFVSSWIIADDRYYYPYGYYHGYYGTHTYGYNPYYDALGSFEYGAGVHTRGYSSPYRHDVHHGYHYNPEHGWHSGTHYGHW